MEITSATKISELIGANKDSINAIASIAKPLEKLKNPILRKVMASRVTIAEAAKMGGCKVEDFERVLQPLGFTFSNSENTITEVEESKPDWLTKAPQENIDIYDVREIINNGSDPLKEILHRFKEVEPGKILNIVNNFVPTPLIHLLQQDKAEASFVETISDHEFHTYFLKKQKAGNTENINPSAEKINMDDAETFENIRNSFTPGRTKNIDVRHLEMPGPMQTILAELETLPNGNALYIDHKRVPVYLLEELADKNYEVHIHNIAEGNVKMLIFRATASSA